MVPQGQLRKKYVVFGGLGSASVAVLLLISLGVLPRLLSQVLVIGIVTGWLALAVFSFVRRFRLPGVALLVLLLSAAAIWIWHKYQEDLPKQQLAAEIKEQGNVHVHVITRGMDTGSFWTGDVYYLYFERGITEPQVRRILRLPGLDGLERLVFKGTAITDATLRELPQLPNLRDVYIEGGNVTDAGVDRLIEACPNCRVEIR